MEQTLRDMLAKPWLYNVYERHSLRDFLERVEGGEVLSTFDMEEIAELAERMQ